MDLLFYKIFIAWCRYFSYDVDTVIKPRMQFAEWNILIGVFYEYDLGSSFLGRKFKKDHSSITNAYTTHQGLLDNDKVYTENFYTFSNHISLLLAKGYDEDSIDLTPLEKQLEKQRLYIKSKLMSKKGQKITEELIAKLLG